MKPVISLITVCLNSERTISRTLESVLTQDYTAYEYIIVDGGSKDSTVRIVEDNMQRFGDRIKLLSEPDKGIYDAMNKGIRLATGDLVCMLNSDDWLEPGALETVGKIYEDRSAEYPINCVIYGMQRRIRDGKVESCGFYGHEFLDRTNIPHQASYISGEVYKKFGLYDTTYKCNSDHEFMLRLYTSGEVEFIPVERVLVNFAVGGMSSGITGHIEDAKIRRKYGIIGRGQYLYLVFRAYFLKMIGRL